MSLIKNIITVMCCMTFLMTPEAADAGYLFHATKGGFASKIAKSGFKTTRMNPRARFGKQIYFSNSAKAAFKEKPNADTLIRFRKSRLFSKRMFDTTRMSENRLRRISGLRDMNGTIKRKRGVIGPKLAHKIGDYSRKNRLIVKYRSARYKPGKNYEFSPSLYRKYPRIVRRVGDPIPRVQIYR